MALIPAEPLQARCLQPPEAIVVARDLVPELCVPENDQDHFSQRPKVHRTSVRGPDPEARVPRCPDLWSHVLRVAGDGLEVLVGQGLLGKAKVREANLEAHGPALEEDIAGLQVSVRKVLSMQEADCLHQLRTKQTRCNQPLQAALEALHTLGGQSHAGRCHQSAALEVGFQIPLGAVLHHQRLVEVAIPSSVLDVPALNIQKLMVWRHVKEMLQAHDEGMLVLSQLDKVFSLSVGVGLSPVVTAAVTADILQLEGVVSLPTLRQGRTPAPQSFDQDDHCVAALAQDLLNDKVGHSILLVGKEPAGDASARLDQEGRKASGHRPSHLSPESVAVMFSGDECPHALRAVGIVPLEIPHFAGVGLRGDDGKVDERGQAKLPIGHPVVAIPPERVRPDARGR
mmetsp:Transcript_164887/g.400790  ORF Transcript_164887/g.400790 Transcript_164887/m.400790 type:complete len:399 (-) Transcript_164887:688-1884(-)